VPGAFHKKSPDGLITGIKNISEKRFDCRTKSTLPLARNIKSPGSYENATRTFEN
jgi:hypothetical protein